MPPFDFAMIAKSLSNSRGVPRHSPRAARHRQVVRRRIECGVD